jgi:hypothetical protein
VSCDVPRSSFSSQISVYAPAKMANPGPSLPLSVLLLSGTGTYTSTLYSYKVSGGGREGRVVMGGGGGVRFT